ncbi:type II secretion system F family protein [Candidatus Micrarchaeota archaeon]|nr:type II secretion system F family protein [Candidatus Micrarchaeota archaeon]
MPDRVPIMLLPANVVRKLGRRTFPPVMLLLPLFPSLKGTLQEIRSEVGVDSFVTASLFSSFIYGLIFFLLSFALLSSRPITTDPLIFSIVLGAVFWLMFFILHIYYPGIIVKKIAAKENKDLLYALREMIIDIDGGVPLFDSMKNISAAGYGYISADFDWVVRQVESGVPEREVLKQLALKTESEFLKRAAWQMVNALESGAKMSDALEGIAVAVEEYLLREIKNYSNNLNFLLLIYMLVGIVAPSLGITFMVLLSAFSGLGVTIEAVMMLIICTSIFQVVMIGYMASTRPDLFGG